MDDPGIGAAVEELVVKKFARTFVERFYDVSVVGCARTLGFVAENSEQGIEADKCAGFLDAAQEFQEISRRG